MSTMSMIQFDAPLPIIRIRKNGHPYGEPGICRALSQKERHSLWGQTVPSGMRLGWTCDVPYCGKPEHFTLAEDKTAGWNNYKEIRNRLRACAEEEWFDLPKQPTDEKSLIKFRAGLGTTGPHFLMRRLKAGGVRIIRSATWGDSKAETLANHPYLRSWAKVKNTIGSVFLGQFWGCWDDLPKERVGACSEKACPFPCMDGATVCKQHWNWDSAIVSYPREQKLNYQREAFARASDDKSIGSGNLDAQFHSGWLGEDKYGFLHTTTQKPNNYFVTRSRAERENDRWWKENVVNQGIEVPGVMVRKTSKELKAEMEAMIDTSLQQYNTEQSAAAIRAFWCVRKEPKPLHDDPFHPNAPRLKIGEGAAVSLKGKMRRGGGHGQGIRKKQRKRAAGWTSGRHNHDPQYFTRETIREMEYVDFSDDSSEEVAAD